MMPVSESEWEYFTLRAESESIHRHKSLKIILQIKICKKISKNAQTTRSYVQKMGVKDAAVVQL